MQYLFFEKGIYGVQWVWGKAPRRWGVFKNFMFLNSQGYFELLSYRKMGKQDVLLAPPIIFFGGQLLSLFPARV